MRLSKSFLIFFVFYFFTCLNIQAQLSRNTTDAEEIWTAYFNQTKLSKKWGIWGDFHFRSTDDFVGKASKGLIRLGATYYLTPDLKFTNGYAYIHHYPEAGHAFVAQPEHRIWHQVQFHSKVGQVRTMQWLRLEERFRRKIKNDYELGEGFRSDERLRYNLLIQVPLSKKGPVAKTFSAMLNSELMINLSHNNVYNVFDQNRFFAGVAYHFDSQSSLQIGYMNIYQQLGAGDKFKNINAFRLFFTQNLDFSAKGK